MFSLWFTLFYQPLFNALIWIYTHVAGQNLGWAVIWLTIFLRLALLPLTIISEYNTVRYKQAVAEAEKAMGAFKNDRLAQNAAARAVMKKFHLSPWAKALTLVIQAVVLILLYQVFIHGISGQKIFKILYPAVDFPGKINTVWYGFEIGQPHNTLWAAVAAGYLLVSIFLEKRTRQGWQKSEMYYLIFFPLFTFAILWYLPMVKSLFILTTMIFSDIVAILRRLLMTLKSKPQIH